MPSSKLTVAHRLADLKPGEMLLARPDGSLRRPMSRPTAMATGLAVGLGLGILGVSVPAFAGLAFAGGILYMRVAGAAYRRAFVASVNWDDRGAFAALDEERWALPFPGRAFAMRYLKAFLHWRAGERERALALLEEMGAERPRKPGAMWWIAALNRVKLLLSMGRVEEARTLRASLADAPPGELVRAEVDAIELLFPLAGASEGPGSDRLHDLAATYLSWELAGHVMQVLLAWGFARGGDVEMSGLCLRRSEETAPPDPMFLAHAYPALAAWVAAHRDAMLAAAPALVDD